MVHHTPNFFLPGHYEMTEEDNAELFEWLEGITRTAFAYMDEVSGYE